jgi:hypothetical protein
MALKTKEISINAQEVFIAVFGGANNDGAGWGITANGKIIKIPGNNPLRDIVALAELAVRTNNAALRTRVEKLVVESVAERRRG